MGKAPQIANTSPVNPPIRRAGVLMEDGPFPGRGLPLQLGGTFFSD